MPALTPSRAFASTAITRACRLALALSGLALTTTACTWNSSSLTSSNIDYRNGGSQMSAPLDVPPDLSQLGASRYQSQGGSISASSIQTATPAQNATAASTQIAQRTTGTARIERGGNQRWIATTLTADQAWPIVHAFWLEQGFKYTTDKPDLGILETEWSENRAKLPKDVVRNALGGLINGLSDTGERDRFRTRIERTAQGTDIFISHNGIAEVVTNGVSASGSTAWQNRPNDPSLEAEMLGRLMLALGGQPQAEQSASAVTQTVAAAPASAPRARMVAGSNAALQVDDDYDRAWRRIGLALDRGAFTVEDRDRGQGLYFVRYVDPARIGQGDPGFFARLFGAKPITAEQQRYRISVKSSGESTTVSVQNNQGQSDNSEVAQRIARLLIEELR